MVPPSLDDFNTVDKREFFNNMFVIKLTAIKEKFVNA